MTGLLAAHAVACCCRLALSCRLVPQLSFQWLGFAASPGCHSEWQWLCRGSAMQWLRCTPQQEASGDRLWVPQVRCMPHGACSTLPPWQEREGPCTMSWHVEGSPSRLVSCWGLGVPLEICCVQRRLHKRLQGQVDRVVWCLANSGGLLMVPRGGCTLLGACTTITLIGSEWGRQGSSQGHTRAGTGHWEVWMRPGGTSLQPGDGIWPACCTTGSPPSFSECGRWQLSPCSLWPHHSCGHCLSFCAWMLHCRLSVEFLLALSSHMELLLESSCL